MYCFKSNESEIQMKKGVKYKIEGSVIHEVAQKMIKSVVCILSGTRKNYILLESEAMRYNNFFNRSHISLKKLLFIELKQLQIVLL